MKTTSWMKLCKGAVLALPVSYGLIYCHTIKYMTKIYILLIVM